MIAYISGEVGRAVLIDGGVYIGMIRNSEKIVSLEASSVSAFLQHSYDVEVAECAGLSGVKERIELHWTRDRAHRMVLMAFDSSEDPQLRASAAKIAEERMQIKECKNFSLRILYSQPMPEKVDCFEVAAFLDRSGAPTLLDIFNDLVYHQDRIIACSNAWSKIPGGVFSDENEQAEFRARIVKIGAFYDFVLGEGDKKAVDNALFHILADSVIGAQRQKALSIASNWGARYRKEEKVSHDYYVGRVDTRLWHEEQSRVPGYIMFERVKKQKDAIKKELISASYGRAQFLIDDLIKDQRQESGSEYLAKTLCDLAIFCRDIGDQGRYMELSLRATIEAPDDAWAYIQLGYAQLGIYHFSAALASFDSARLYGDERSALIGKAEVMRYMGCIDEAIQLLDECLIKYPGDEVAKNSRASILAYAGKFEEAMVIYDEIISSPFAGAYAYGGRASVLSDLGRFEEAAVDQEMAIHLSKDDPISYCAMADILREAGKYKAALDILSRSPNTAQSRLAVSMARARIYRDQGEFSRALGELERTAASFPLDAWIKLAIADIYRRIRRYQDAIEIYSQLDRESVHSKVARNSAAACYAASNKLDLALSFIPVRLSSTKHDWIGQGIRAAILVKQGALVQAREFLDECIESCPWERQKVGFLATKALIEMKMGQKEAAALSLRDVDVKESSSWLKYFKRLVGSPDAARSSATRITLAMPVLVDFDVLIKQLEVGQVDFEPDVFELGLEVVLAVAA